MSENLELDDLELADEIDNADPINALSDEVATEAWLWATSHDEWP